MDITSYEYDLVRAALYGSCLKNLYVNMYLWQTDLKITCLLMAVILRGNTREVIYYTLIF